MKKIYILTAIFALLALSLNAQGLHITGWDYPSSFPTTWTVPYTGSGTVGGYYFGGSSGADIIIPSSDLQGYSNVTVKLTAAKENTYDHSVSVNDVTSSPALTTSLVELTWENVNATNGITIHVSDYYVNISSIHVYAPVTDPTIIASTNSISMNAAPGGNTTETVTINGYNLTQDINASISGDAVFSVDPTILGATGGSLTVTYSPTAPGNHSATITLTSDGAEAVTINLTGSCVAGTTYELVTDPSTQLVDGEKYILVGNTKYAMGAISSNVGTVVAITDNGDGTVTVPGTASPLVFTLHSYSSNYTSGYALEANGNYLRPSSSTGTGLTTATSSNDNTCWSPVADVKSTGGYGIQYSYLSTSRAVSFRESSSVSARFAYYAKTNITATSNEYFYGLLYKEVSNTPVLTVPTNGEEINVGESLGGASVTKTITVSGRNLTEDLTVSVSGTGFTVSPTTLSAADVNNGTATVTITYSGTANGTGSMTISSNEVSVTVDLTATYVDTTPVLTAPENNSTVNVGTNTGSGVSKTINVKGQYLTQDLTVSVSGDGFTVSRDVTVTAAEANAGQDITVTYNGTNANATGTLTISSSEVSATVNLTATYSDNGEITVANGTTADMYLPVYGSYYEEVQLNQMIYPSSMLSDMEGKYITSITFYPATYTTGGTTYSGIRFEGGKVMLSLGNTSNSSFTTNAVISADVTQVAEIDNVEQNFNQTTWTFTFDTPYLYEGGNLLVQVNTEAGDYNRTYFYGTTMSNMGRHQCTSSNSLHNFLPKATFTYQSNAPVVPAVEGGLLRLHLLFCDQLKASIPEDNSHPDAYGYILRFEPEGGETKESGEVRVNIQKTDCEVMGYYTLDQIDRDTNRGLTMDVITADVEYNLSSTNDLLNYYYLQGKVNGYPSLDGDYLSKLYRQEDFTYREMYEGSYEFDHVFNSGEHHYFNSAIDPIIGSYGDASKFVSYAPSVTTWGVQRRYFELDMKDNTYGGPVWKTAVGKAQMGLTPDEPDDPEYKPVVEFQEGWNTSWTVDGKGANLYMLDNINAIGYLPPQSLTKVKFEPYMFRVFVESDNGMLRPFKYVKDDKGNNVITADEEGSTTGPICVWSGYIKRDDTGKIINDPENGATIDSIGTYGPYLYTKNKVNRANPNDEWTLDENNAIFGALDELIITGYDNDGKPILRDIPEEDLRIFVRFYFSVMGEAADHTPWTRVEGSRSGNGAESSGSAAGGVATGVKELQYHGEVVETIYYNVQGMMSDKPFDGVNVVVTRYSDGATVISKVVR